MVGNGAPPFRIGSVTAAGVEIDAPPPCEDGGNWGREAAPYCEDAAGSDLDPCAGEEGEIGLYCRGKGNIMGPRAKDDAIRAVGEVWRDGEGGSRGRG